MKTSVLGLISVLAVSSVTVAMAQDTTPVDPLTAEARAKVKVFGQAMKQALKGEMKANGPIGAVKVCNEESPLITAQQATEGWQVGRTALKVRNADNAADDWETSILQQFETQLAEGANPKTLEYSESVNGEFRYMKAIPTGKVCMACHGSNINPELKQHIDQHYPQDQAVGFTVGQLRGAFTLRKPLD